MSTDNSVWLDYISKLHTYAAAQTVRADENERDAKRLKHLHNDPKRAQAYFWNHQGRKERNAAIDDTIKEPKT